jgi:hypothetical protein
MPTTRRSSVVESHERPKTEKVGPDRLLSGGMNRSAPRATNLADGREPNMSRMPLQMVAVMWDAKKKIIKFGSKKQFGGFDVWSVGPPDHTNRPKDIDQLDRNMVFLEFNSFRNKGGMIFVINADDPAAKVLQRLKTTKQKIPFLQFQLGQYPNRRAQTSVKGFISSTCSGSTMSISSKFGMEYTAGKAWKTSRLLRSNSRTAASRISKKGNFASIDPGCVKTRCSG